MNSSEAEAIVVAACVDPAYYSIGAERHEALCLLHEGTVWRVFLSERGRRYEEQSFPDEDAACVFFLKRLFQLWRPRASVESRE